MHNIKKTQIDPEMRNIGCMIRTVLPYFTDKSFRLTQKVSNFYFKKKWRGLDCNHESIEIERPDKSKLRIVVCSPKKQKQNVPGLLWIHGGGYAVGSPELEAAYISRFVTENGCIVVSPDYRLSSEAPYPAALDDCYLALKWMKEHSEEYGIRDDQLFIGGGSAGGGMTAALSLYARDKKEVSIAFQMPFYPMLDDRMITPSSQNNDAPVWNTKSSELAWKNYLGELYKTDKVPPYASAARATDYSNLPPTCTFVGTIEPFHDETVNYVNALKKAGVTVEFMEFEGCFHLFDTVAPKSKAAKKATDFYMNAFRFATENYFSAQP